LSNYLFIKFGQLGIIMSQEEIAKIKLACLEQARFQCQFSPSEILVVAKKLYEWITELD
jgi:hypothetical protein